MPGDLCTGRFICIRQSLSSESLLVNVLKRAKELAGEGIDLYSTPALRFFLYNKIGKADLDSDDQFYTRSDCCKFHKA